MKLYLITFLLLIYNFSHSQTPREKLDYLKSYLNSTKDFNNEAKTYTESESIMKKLNLIDSLLNLAISEANEIVLPADNTDSGIIVTEASEPAYQETTGDIYTQTDEYNPTTSSMFDRINPLKKSKTHFFLEFGVNSFHLAKTNNELSPKINPGGSWFTTWGINKEIYNSKALDITLGLSYQRNCIKYSNNTVLSTGDNVKYTKADVNFDPELRVGYLGIPLNLDFKLSKKIGLQLGGSAWYKTNSNFRLRTKDDDAEIDQRIYDDFNLNQWQFALRGGFSISKLNLFTQYHLSNIFNNNANYDHKLFMIGTTLKI